MSEHKNETLMNRRNFFKIASTSVALTGAAILLTGCEEETASFANTAKMAILMDSSLCVECHACRVACQNHNGLPVEQSYISFPSIEKGKFPKVEYHLTRKSCMHCTDAPCVDACPMQALYKGESGFTHMNFEACIGCGVCKSVCPYDIPVINEGKMYKCTGCQDLVSAGKEPACVDTCISNAVQYGSAEELIAKANERVAKIKGKYPAAALYGVTQQNGLGLLLILRTDAKDFALV